MSTVIRHIRNILATTIAVSTHGFASDVTIEAFPPSPFDTNLETSLNAETTDVPSPETQKVTIHSSMKVTDLLDLPPVRLDELIKKVNAKTRVIVAESEEEKADLLEDSTIPEVVVSVGAAAAKQLVITKDEESLSFSPQKVTFKKIGETLKVKMAEVSNDAPVPLSLFVRDASFVEWNEGTLTLSAKKAGQTEAYVVFAGKMYILPISIQDETAVASKDALPDFTIPSSLLSLENLFDNPINTQAYAGTSTPTKQAEKKPQDLQLPDEVIPSDEIKNSFSLAKMDLKHKRVAIQVIDNRSDPHEKVIYPVRGAKVTVPGTTFEGYSDSSGYVVIENIPIGSRFLVSVSDPDYRWLAVTTEVQTTATEKQDVITVKLTSQKVFEAITQIHDVIQDPNLGSYCGKLVDEKYSPLVGYSVSLNVRSEGAYYFNQYGPSRTSLETDASGKFCFYNVKPGLAEMSVSVEGKFYDAIAIPVFGGRHVEEDLRLGSDFDLDTHLIGLPSVWEQLYGQTGPAPGGPQPVDYVDVDAVGTGARLAYEGPGHLKVEGLSTYKGRVHGLVHAAEFESMLVSYSKGTRDNLTPLLHRGFIEDLYHELYVSQSIDEVYDPAAGVLVVYFGKLQGEDLQKIQLKLVRDNGEEVEGGWYFGDNNDGIVKAVFFNLDPGVYSVIAESEYGVWLDSDTAAVDNWTVSTSHLGANYLAD
ncbi:MAG: hypothetical protein AB7T49_01920 [Oligoflexales bacterium]